MKGALVVILLVVAVAVSGYVGFANGLKAGFEVRRGLSQPGTATPAQPPPREPDADGVWHVRPGHNIQDVIELAARHPRHKKIRVHAGTYSPFQHARALIWLNRKHDGITLEADGEVVLTAANPAIADPTVESWPAVVNHVVYFGDGITKKTVLRGFKITGANNFCTRSDEPGPVQPEVKDHENFTKGRDHVFYKDGGGIKIWGRCYPVIDNVEIYGCYTSPCGAALSVQLLGFNDKAPLVKNSIFRDNRSQITGSAIDLFGPGNALELENCLFVGNVSNRGINFFAFPQVGVSEQNGSGALTVFQQSKLRARRCTFTGNYNGVDDMGEGNVYERCLFWKNDARGGTAPLGRYEIDIRNAQGVTGCVFGGPTIHDLRGAIDKAKNVSGAPDPRFDDDFTPQAPEYQNVGYRPVTAQ